MHAKAKQAKSNGLLSPTMEKALPGERELASAIVDVAVVDLNRIYVTKGLETARAIGEYVIAQFFGGDPANFRERGNGHISFRELGKRDDLQVSWQFIWNAVSVVEHLSTLPSAVAEALPLSHHKLLLTVKDEEARRKLAEEAAAEGLSKREFEERVKQTRPTAGGTSKAGRPPLPGFVKAFTALKRIVKTATDGEISEASFEHFSRQDARALLAEMEEQIATLAAVAARVREHVGD